MNILDPSEALKNNVKPKPLPHHSSTDLKTALNDLLGKKSKDNDMPDKCLKNPLLDNLKNSIKL
mgnify:CR=1 FL=1